MSNVDSCVEKKSCCQHKCTSNKSLWYSSKCWVNRYKDLYCRLTTETFILFTERWHIWCRELRYRRAQLRNCKLMRRFKNLPEETLTRGQKQLSLNHQTYDQQNFFFFYWASVDHRLHTGCFPLFETTNLPTYRIPLYYFYNFLKFVYSMPSILPTSFKAELEGAQLCW